MNLLTWRPALIILQKFTRQKTGGPIYQWYFLLTRTTCPSVFCLQTECFQSSSIKISTFALHAMFLVRFPFSPPRNVARFCVLKNISNLPTLFWAQIFNIIRKKFASEITMPFQFSKEKNKHTIWPVNEFLTDNWPFKNRMFFWRVFCDPTHQTWTGIKYKRKNSLVITIYVLSYRKTSIIQH